METESEVLVNKMQTESEVLMEKMETESVELVEPVLAVKDVSKGVGDGGAVANDIACKDLVLVSVTEQDDEVIAEEVVLPLTKDDQTEIEKCTLMLQALPTTSGGVNGNVVGNVKAIAAEENNNPLDASQAAEMVTQPNNDGQGQAASAVAKKQEGCDGAGDGAGDGKAPAPEENITPLGASQATEMVIERSEEVGQAALVVNKQEGFYGNDVGNDGDGVGNMCKAPAAEENSSPVGASQATEIMATQLCEEAGHAALVVAKAQEGCNGDGDGDGAGDGKDPPMDETPLPEFLPEPEKNEPSWDDVPVDIPVEPVLPARPPKRPRVAPECVEVDDVVQTMRNILFNL